MFAAERFRDAIKVEKPPAKSSWPAIAALRLQRVEELPCKSDTHPDGFQFRAHGAPSFAKNSPILPCLGHPGDASWQLVILRAFAENTNSHQRVVGSDVCCFGDVLVD